MLVAGKEAPGLPLECGRFMVCWLVAFIWYLVPATGTFVRSAFNFIFGLAGALLDAANQFILLALGELQIVIRKLCEFLFQFALGNVPVSFGDESAHMTLDSVSVVCFRRATRRGGILPASGVPTGWTDNFSEKPSI